MPFLWCNRSWECDCCRTYKLTIGQLKRKCIIKEWPMAIGDEHRSVFNSWQKTSLFMPNDWKVEEIDFPRYALRLITSVLTDRLDAWSIRIEAEKCSSFRLFISTDLFEFLISEMSRSRDLLKHDANVGVILLTTLRKCAHEY